MGLIAQALAGGISAGANMGAAAMFEQFRAGLQEERDKAQALRQENLVRLHSQLNDQNAQAAEQRKLDSTVNPDYIVNDTPVTQPRLIAAIKNKQAGQAAQSAVNNRVQNVESQYEDMTEDDQRPDATADYEQDIANAKATPEEQAAIEKGNSTNIGNIKTSRLEAKLENQKELSEAKLAMSEKVANIRADAIQANADLKFQTAIQIANMKMASGNTRDIQEGRLELQRAEAQRKAANNAAQLVQRAGGYKKLDAAQKAQYKTLIKLSGEEDPFNIDTISQSEAPQTLPKQDDFWEGIQKKITGLIGTNSNSSKYYDYRDLPAGSQPVAGKFTKDGRPVFKTPSGQLVAPKAR